MSLGLCVALCLFEELLAFLKDNEIVSPAHMKHVSCDKLLKFGDLPGGKQARAWGVLHLHVHVSRACVCRGI